MAENTKIEWTDHTFNPWEGCQKVGPGCDNCYAETRNARFAGGQAINWGPGAPRRLTSASNWYKPGKWNANHEAFFAEHGRRQRVFCASLADVFDNAVPAEWRADLFTLIRSTPNLDWLLLTKRIGNAKGMIEQAMRDQGDVIEHAGWPWANVWIGATIVNQDEADRDIPKLMNVPARVHFLSMEPLLESVDLKLMQYEDSDHRQPDGKIIANTRCRIIKWVIVGGESGPGARPMHPDWARSLRDQCRAAGVPFLFKQHGDWMPAEKDGDTLTLVFPAEGPHGPSRPEFYDWPDGACAARVGKKAAGRLLDGRTWDEFPNS